MATTRTPHEQRVLAALDDGLRWDFIRALELALFRTYAVPSIGGLLYKTGEFRRNGQKRYDDTTLLILTMLRDGLDGSLGSASLARMNRTHAHYTIRNDDFLFVLSTFVLDPIRWCERFAWRPLTADEQHALFQVWCEIGQRMGLQDIPETLAEMTQRSDAYVAQHFAHTQANQAVGEATLDIVRGWLPQWLRRAVRPTLATMLDTPTRRAMGVPDPNRLWSIGVRGLLTLRAGLMRKNRLLRGWLDTDWPDGRATYPSGYTPGQLAPQRLLDAEARRELRFTQSAASPDQ